MVWCLEDEIFFWNGNLLGGLSGLPIRNHFLRLTKCRKALATLRVFCQHRSARGPCFLATFQINRSSQERPKHIPTLGGWDPMTCKWWKTMVAPWTGPKNQGSKKLWASYVRDTDKTKILNPKMEVDGKSCFFFSKRAIFSFYVSFRVIYYLLCQRQGQRRKRK